MTLSEILSGVVGYNYQLGKDQSAQIHLRGSRASLESLLPPLGYRVGASGVKAQRIPILPWFAIFDPDVTKVATRGQYVAFLYDSTISRVYLSMNQGAMAHKAHYIAQQMTESQAEKAALAEIAAETMALRKDLGAELLAGTLEQISLGGARYLGVGYETGSVAALSYDLQALPSEDTLRRDLDRFLEIYQEAVNARLRLVARSPELFNVGAPPPEGPGTSPEFKPKDASEYSAWVTAHNQKRSRKHESLVNNFAAHAQGLGWSAGTRGYHPRDLVLERDGKHLLVEAKTVGTNSELAVREVIGQLLAYEYIYYEETTQKVALFSAPVGELWVRLLARLGIDVVWAEGASWRSAGESVAWA